MQLTKQLLKRRAQRIDHVTAGQHPDPPKTPDVRVGAPDDKALNTCACGHAFKASVTTSVECPRCGTGQPGSAGEDRPLWTEGAVVGAHVRRAVRY